MPKLAESPFPALVINATERERVALAIVTSSKIVKFERQTRAQELPAMIAAFLEENRLSLADVKLFAVMATAGSLTGTRIGVSVANTLSWLQNRPVVSLKSPTLLAAIRELKAVSKLPKKFARVVNETLVH